VYDLNTLFGTFASTNTLLYFHGLSIEKATEVVCRSDMEIDCLGQGNGGIDENEGNDEDLAREIISTVLFGSIIVRTTGRPWALEQWCNHYRTHQKTNVSENSHSESGDVSGEEFPAAAYNGTYLPTPHQDHVVQSFTAYVKGTITDANS
jgi:hypothetical protein